MENACIELYRGIQELHTLLLYILYRFHYNCVNITDLFKYIIFTIHAKLHNIANTVS